jgi:hypothetical protein
MNIEDLKEVNYSVLILSQISFTGPYVAVVLLNGKEVYRTYGAHPTAQEALMVATEKFLSTAGEVIQREIAKNN